MKDFFPNELICCFSITGSLDVYIFKFKFWIGKAFFLLAKKFQEMGTKSLIQSV